MLVPAAFLVVQTNDESESLAATVVGAAAVPRYLRKFIEDAEAAVSPYESSSAMAAAFSEVRFR